MVFAFGQVGWEEFGTRPGGVVEFVLAKFGGSWRGPQCPRDKASPPKLTSISGSIGEMECNLFPAQFALLLKMTQQKVIMRVPGTGSLSSSSKRKGRRR